MRSLEHWRITAAHSLLPELTRRGNERVTLFDAFVKHARGVCVCTPELASRNLLPFRKDLTDPLDVHEAAIVQVLREVMQILESAA